MKLSVLTGSVSRMAGGTFTSIRRPNQVLAEKFSYDVEIFGLQDRFTQEDLAVWSPLKPQVFSVRGPRSFGYAPGYSGAVASSCPDIMQVHGIWMYYSLVEMQVARQQNIPYLIHPHGMLDSWAVGNSSWKKSLARILFEDRHLRDAAVLRALCVPEANAMRGLGLKNPTCLIPNGIDLPSDAVNASPPWDERVESGKKMLVFLGRIHPKKGLPILLDAWRKVQSECSSAAGWILVIAGWDQGEHEAELKKYVEEHSLEDSVIFLGPLFGEVKQSALSNADAFVLPSHSEGLPMTVLEAWANHLPVLMTPACNLPIGFESDAAISILPDSTEISAGLQSLFAMTDVQRKTMGARGRKLVAERFSWETVADQLHEVYTWILGGGSPPACVEL